MKNLKGIVGGYSSKVQRSEVCCNSTGLMDRWMFPPDDGPVPDCCGDLTGDEPILTEGDDPGSSGRATSGTYFFPARICPITVRFTNTVSNVIPGIGEVIGLDIYINNVAFPLTINGSNTFTINPGDEIYFDIDTNVRDAKGCHYINISMVNLTCNVSYNNITRLFLNGTFDCMMCPWDFPDVETALREYLYGPYVNTTNTVLTFIYNTVITLIFNADTNITAYYGSDPIYSNNPSVQIVNNGLDAGLPQSLILNAGEYIWVYCENLSNGLLSQYSIDFTINGNCGDTDDSFEITLNK